jgi:hypothetical protein
MPGVHDEPISDQCDAEAVRSAHERAMEAGEPMYLDPITGLSVMTATTLLARGHCCGSGCRHCPYPSEG